MSRSCGRTFSGMLVSSRYRVMRPTPSFQIWMNTLPVGSFTETLRSLPSASFTVSRGGDSRRTHGSSAQGPRQVPVLRFPRRVPRGGRRGGHGGGRMKHVDFTPDQQRAIGIGKRQLDACVVAGPGSGKTTVLVEHFGRLVVEARVDPLRILAITFTEKAAGNMRKKLAERFQSDLGMRAKMERAWVSTVHGFCTRLLKENAVFAGVDPEFTVADANESKRLQLESMSAAMDGLLAEHPAGMKALIRGLSSADFDRAVLDAYDAMRGAGVRVEQLPGFAAPAGTTVSEVGETLSALRNEPLTNWSYSQKEELRGALDGGANPA